MYSKIILKIYWNSKFQLEFLQYNLTAASTYLQVFTLVVQTLSTVVASCLAPLQWWQCARTCPWSSRYIKAQLPPLLRKPRCMCCLTCSHREIIIRMYLFTFRPSRSEFRSSFRRRFACQAHTHRHLWYANTHAHVGFWKGEFTSRIALELLVTVLFSIHCTNAGN